MWCYCDQDADAEVLNNCTVGGTDMELPYRCTPSKVAKVAHVQVNCSIQSWQSSCRFHCRIAQGWLAVLLEVKALCHMSCRCPIDFFIIVSKLQKSGASLRHPSFLQHPEVGSRAEAVPHPVCCKLIDRNVEASSLFAAAAAAAGHAGSSRCKLSTKHLPPQKLCAFCAAGARFREAFGGARGAAPGGSRSAGARPLAANWRARTGWHDRPPAQGAVLCLL